MSEQQAAQAHIATAPAAVAARPRISADAFRNLTARLKKTDAAIPDLTPARTVAPPAVDVAPEAPKAVAELSPVIEAAPVIVEAPQPHIPVEVALEPVVIEALPVAVEVPELVAEVAPAPVVISDFDIAPVDADFAPHVAEPVVEAVAAPADMLIESLLPAGPAAEVRVEGVQSPEPQIDSAFGIEPLAFEALPPSEPVAQSLAVADVETAQAPVADIFLELPQAEPEAVSAVVAAVEAEPDLNAVLPDLPPFVANPVFVPEPAPEPVAAEPALNGGFADNFTYVPEPGKDTPAAALSQSDLADIDEAVRQELAQRAVELELENIWRLLLAKPTSDDRATYMREAAEYHAADEEWNKPAPEHDLSAIQPAALVDAEVVESLPLIDEPSETSAVVTPLPQVAGQDVAELARSLLDMMAAGNASGLPQERALAADTLLRLVPRLDLKPVILLAERLAMMDSPPHLLVTRLIRDPRPEVAGPLLEDCMHIPDKDLESLVVEGEPEKLRLIARRRRLSRAISDALIKSGDPSVVLTLIRNAEAEISHDGFQSLLVLCENNPDLLAPLATRHDLSAPFAFELFWLAPAQLRRFILSRFLTDSETLTKILKITMATNLEDEGESEGLSQHSLLEALERAARGHVDVAAEELATLLQVAPATVTRILGDLEGEPLVVMLKAAGYPRSAMSGLLKRMQDADLPIISRHRDITELQMMFETLSFNKARILLTYWDWAVVKLGPYAPVH